MSVDQSDADVVEVTRLDDGTYRTYHDMTEPGLGVTIAVALDEITDEDAGAIIRDLAEYADPDALDRVLRSHPEHDARERTEVSLTIDGHEVTVYGDGEIRIEP